jgi:hypothetical protein
MTTEGVTVNGVDTAEIRSRSEIEDCFAALEAEIASTAAWEASGGYVAPTLKESHAGHLAALRWILYGGPAPFTAKTSDRRALWDEGDLPGELALAFEKRAVMDELFPGHGPVSDPRPSGRTKSWLHAVELTFDWALGRDDRNPLTAL